MINSKHPADAAWIATRRKELLDRHEREQLAALRVEYSGVLNSTSRAAPGDAHLVATIDALLAS